MAMASDSPDPDKVLVVTQEEEDIIVSSKLEATDCNFQLLTNPGPGSPMMTHVAT
jgi:hypothetical protein